MTDRAPQNLVELKLARERALETINLAYATDLIDDVELERRIDVAQAATTTAELTTLVRDLEGVESLLGADGAARAAANSTALVRAGSSATPALAETRATAASTALVPIAEAPATGRMVSVFSNSERKGHFTLPRSLRVLTVFGNSEIDLREARLAPGENVVRATSVFGNVEVIVPPDVPVLMEGTGVLGNFEHDGDAHDVASARAYVRVSGIAVFGNVEVSERLAGESARQARKRRKRERKALAAAATDQRLALRGDVQDARPALETGADGDAARGALPPAQPRRDEPVDR